jgi:hypothetical protein
MVLAFLVPRLSFERRVRSGGATSPCTEEITFSGVKPNIGEPDVRG